MSLKYRLLIGLRSWRGRVEPVSTAVGDLLLCKPVCRCVMGLLLGFTHRQHHRRFWGADRGVLRRPAFFWMNWNHLPGAFYSAGWGGGSVGSPHGSVRMGSDGSGGRGRGVAAEGKDFTPWSVFSETLSPGLPAFPANMVSLWYPGFIPVLMLVKRDWT